jgi:hypothetical protein
MIYKESYWKSQNRTFNDYFTLSVDEFATYLHIKNKKDARLTLEALYRAGLIDIKAQDGIRLAAKVKLNWDKIKDWDLGYVERLPRTEQTTYSTTPETTQKSTVTGTGVGTAWDTTCTPTLELEQELEQNIQKEKERELKQEPSAIETSPMTLEEYLQSFIEKYPYINYSYSPDKFYDTYYTSYCAGYGPKIKLLFDLLAGDAYERAMPMKMIDDNTIEFSGNAYSMIKMYDKIMNCPDLKVECNVKREDLVPKWVTHPIDRFIKEKGTNIVKDLSSYTVQFRRIG